MGNENSNMFIFVTTFFIILTIVSVALSDEMPSLLKDGDLEDLKDTQVNGGFIDKVWNSLTIVWKLMSFQVTDQVPLWVTLILYIVPIMTIFLVAKMLINR